MFQPGKGSKMINQCVCSGLHKAVSKLSDSTKQLCDNQDAPTSRDGKLFNWEASVDKAAEAYTSKGTTFYEKIKAFTGIGGF